MVRDRRGRLREHPFSYVVTGDGRVRISRGGREVTVLGARESARLLARIKGADEEAVQHALARATGNYKRG